MGESNGNTEPITIDAWFHYYISPEFLDGIRSVAAEFERIHPEYRIRITGHHFEDMPGAVASAASRGKHPAIAEYLYLSTREALDTRDRNGRPLFRSVEGALRGREEIRGQPVVLGDVLPSARDYFSYRGEVMAMPWMVSTPLMLVNRSLLDRAGVERVPRTWRELAEACAAVRASPGGPDHGVTWANYGWFFQHAVAIQGGLLADRDNGRQGRPEKVLLDSPEALAYARWWQSMHREGHYLYTGTKADSRSTPQAFSEAHAAFAEERVAFVWGSSVEAAQVVEAGRAQGFEVSTHPIPHNDAVPPHGHLIGGDALWLSDGLPDEVERGALAFLQFLDSPEVAARRHQSTGFSPVTRSAVSHLTRSGWFELNSHHRTAVELLDAHAPTPAARGALIQGFSGVHDIVTDAMHDVLLARAEPATRLREAAEQARSLLNERTPPGATVREMGRSTA
ncbi:extracellular solute-binding protein [Nocardiopsis sp. B62]|uniref:extracellular solute-binding protein n=1 Tax=Nocardiopsis sp. B62 TaxID=2824874 RepID=UPI001B35A430|nr:extracellular solute-binding protein [Nocardiopsis sp. B62]MBQ1080604.1 extracellular solute-binding protein [Nocardiopsis sp. B62]